MNKADGQQFTYDDIADYIRSVDMRELVQKAAPVLSPADVEQIILYSDMSLKHKADELEALAEDVPSKGDSEKILQMADMLKRCLRQIYKPKERVLYILRQPERDDIYCYDSFSDLEDEWCDPGISGENAFFPCYHITQLVVGKERTVKMLDFTIQGMDGPHDVSAVQPSGDWFRDKGISRETARRFCSGMDLDVLGLKIPDDELWKYQTPSMKQPAYGVLHQDRTQNCWTFISRNNMDNEVFDNLDADYSGDMFSVLDWLEKVPEEEIEDKLQLPFE